MTVSEIKSTLQELGIRPSKELGQHFLLDQRTIDFIIEQSQIQKGEKVLEIGPGLGVLTEALARAGAEVVAVEKDKILARHLTEKFHNWRNVTIVNRDALLFAPDPRVLSTYKLVANLPYNITSPLLRKFLEQEPRPHSIVVMVQKEVGERLVAPPGDTNRGVLSVMVQFYGRPEIIGHVPRSQFWPPPEVDSVILKISDIESQKSDVDPKTFFTVVKAGFSKKRAQLKNALKNNLHLNDRQTTALVSGSNIDPTKRAEDLSLEEWVSLAQTLSKI